MNQDFASYVRSARFSLTLSEEMIDAILGIDRDLNALKKDFGMIFSRCTSNALYRRGLVIPSKHGNVPQDWAEAPQPSCYELTPAGQLVADLLKEAGFKAWEVAVFPEEASPQFEVTLKDHPKA